MIIVYILLFILCLSILIMVHEAGHLATAKIFKVYCFEYAIGFGPKLFSKKRKNGETYFSIRAIPFGGFVSMYGESETVPEGLTIDPSRSLLAIKKWKRAIIMAAGVTMNFLLALVIFFIYEVGFPSYTARYGHITVLANSKAAEVGLKSGSNVYAQLSYNGDNAYVFYDDKAVITYPGQGDVPVYFGYDLNGMTLKDTYLCNHTHAFKKISVGSVTTVAPSVTVNEILDESYIVSDEYLTLTAFMRKGVVTSSTSELVNFTISVSDDMYTDKDTKVLPANFSISKENYDKFSLIPRDSEIKIVGKVTLVNEVKTFVASEYLSYRVDYAKDLFAAPDSGDIPEKINFNIYVSESGTSSRGEAKNFDIGLTGASPYRLETNIGVSMQLDEKRNNFGEAVRYTFEDFGTSSTAIVRGLAALFTSENAWKDVGGIISIGVVSTQVLQENGFGNYLRIWGLISVNLGIVNLFPFPGLDGWQLLVLAVEGIFRKEIPAKVKNIVSAVGIILLMGLMVLILIKDVIGLV